MFKVVNIQPIPDVRQGLVGGIEEHVCTCIVLRPDPFPFEYSPKCLCDVQVWGVWWQEEEEESPLFPYRPEFPDPLVAMHGGIGKHDKGLPVDTEGELIEETDDRAPAVRRSVVVNPSYWLSRVIIPKMLSLATLWEGTNTPSPFICHP